MTAIVSEVAIPIEAPQLVYPKGPIRRIVSYVEAEDEIAGHIVVTRLVCGHEATLCGPFPFDQNSVIVKCGYCHHERFADGGRKF